MEALQRLHRFQLLAPGMCVQTCVSDLVNVRLVGRYDLDVHKEQNRPQRHFFI